MKETVNYVSRTKNELQKSDAKIRRKNQTQKSDANSRRKQQTQTSDVDALFISDTDALFISNANEVTVYRLLLFLLIRCEIYISISRPSFGNPNGQNLDLCVGNLL